MSEPSQHRASRVGHSWFAFPTRGGIPALKIHPYHQCEGLSPGDSMSVNEVDCVTASGFRRRRRLQSLRRRLRPENANGISSRPKAASAHPWLARFPVVICRPCAPKPRRTPTLRPRTPHIWALAVPFCDTSSRASHAPMSNDRSGQQARWHGGAQRWVVEAVVLLPRPHCSLESKQEALRAVPNP